jgi:hypothetical protein
MRTIDAYRPSEAAAARIATAREMVLSSLEAAGLAMDLSKTGDGLEIPELGKDTTRTVILDGKKIEMAVRPFPDIYSGNGKKLYFLPTSSEDLSRVLSEPRNPVQGVIFRNS